MGHRGRHEPLEQLNTRHLDELDAIVRAFGGVGEVRGVRAERVDAEGIDIAVESPTGTTMTRVGFLEPVNDYPAGVRVAFVRLARRARAVLDANDTAMTAGTVPNAKESPAEASGATATSPRWMRICGTAVFVGVLVLLGFLLPPLFGDSDSPGAPGGAGVHGPPTSAPAPAGGHTPPAGGHVPPGGGG